MKKILEYRYVAILLAAGLFVLGVSASIDVPQASAGLDRGTFDVLQMGALPSAWIWVEDDTIDGSGVEYWALHASFVHPGPSHPSVGLTIEHQAGINHTSLQDFLAWVVASNPHVNSAAELDVQKRVVSPVGGN